MREHDKEPAERLIAAMKALSDNELLAVVQPLVDVQQMVIENRLLLRPRDTAPLATLSGNPRCVEYLEAIGQWAFAELHHREEVLEQLQEEK